MMEVNWDGFATLRLLFDFRIGTETICQTHLLDVEGVNRVDSTDHYRCLRHWNTATAAKLVARVSHLPSTALAKALSNAQTRQASADRT